MIFIQISKHRATRNSVKDLQEKEKSQSTAFAPTPCRTITRVRQLKTNDNDLRGLNIHEPSEHNSMGYLGGIIDEHLDASEDAKRVNVTTFIDFMASKTLLYRSRPKRFAKTRMRYTTLFLYIVEVPLNMHHTALVARYDTIPVVHCTVPNLDRYVIQGIAMMYVCAPFLIRCRV